MINPILSLEWILLTLFSFFIIYAILIPYKKLLFYKKQGAEIYYSPFAGYLKALKDMLHKHGESQYLLKKIVKENPNIPVFAANVGLDVFIFVRDVTLQKELLKDIYSHKRDLSFQIPAFMFSEESLSGVPNHLWKKRKNLISNVFRFDIIGSKNIIISQTAKEVFAKFKFDDKPVILHDFIAEIAGCNIGKIFFGEELKNHELMGQTLTQYLSYVSADAGKLMLSLPVILFGKKIMKLGLLESHRRYMKNLSTFKKKILSIIEEKKESGRLGDDLISLLLSTQNHADPDLRYNERTIYDEFILFYQAGTDNVSYSLTGCFYYLAKYPEYMERVRKEVDEFYSDTDLSSMSNLTFLNAFIKEVFRVMSPAIGSVPRILLEDKEINGFKFLKGAKYQISFLMNFHNPAFFDEPQKFDPERWLREDISKMEQYAFIPFSAGPRNCLGQHFAMNEMRIVISEFVKNYDIQVAPGYKLELLQKFLYVPKEDIPFIVKRRV